MLCWAGAESSALSMLPGCELRHRGALAMNMCFWLLCPGLNAAFATLLHQPHWQRLRLHLLRPPNAPLRGRLPSVLLVLAVVDVEVRRLLL